MATNAPSAQQSGSLYVGELHPDVPEALLYEIFNGCGPVASVRVCRDVQTRRSLGYAYVNFHDVEHAQKALDTMNFKEIMGKNCRIMWSQRDPLLRKSGLGNIFVKNLVKTIDNLTLHDTFSVFGIIMSCKVITNQKGESLGYGFVHFADEESAQKAIAESNGRKIDGQVVNVVAFKSKKERGLLNEARFTNVYIKNLPSELDEAKVKAMVEKFGNVTSMFLPEEEKKRGFAFVNFGSHEEAKACVDELHGKAVEGTEKVLYVARAQKKEEREKELRDRFENWKAEKNNKANLYVKNLADTIDDEKLRKLFAEFGSITSARVMVEPSKQKSLGFGFVNFSNADEANNAMMKMNGMMIENKPLYVNLAQRKDQRRKQLEKLHSMKAAGSMPQSQMYSANGPMFYRGPPQLMYPGQQPFMGQRFYPQQPQMMGPGGVGAGAQYSLLPVPNQRPGQLRNQPRAGGRPGPRQGQPGQPGVGVPGVKPTGVPQNPAQAAAVAQARVQQQARNVNFQQQNIRYESNVRNQVQPAGMPQRPAQVMGPETIVPSATQSLIKALAAADDKMKKRLIGERLFPLIRDRQPTLAGKITGMLLEMDDGELINLLESVPALDEKIEEALKVLKDDHLNNPPTGTE